MIKKRPLNLDWQKLSFVEYASGIEVFHASLFFKDEKNLQKRILDHALDEYRHSNYFYALSKKNGRASKISTPHGLISYGGLLKSPFPADKDKIVSICSYLYVGEIRAISFGKTVQSDIKSREILNIFKIIEKDEINHAKGLKNFLSKNKLLRSKFYILKNKFYFFLSDRSNFGFPAKLKSKAEQFMIRSIFNLFPESIFQLKDNNDDFNEAFKNRGSLS